MVTKDKAAIIKVIQEEMPYLKEQFGVEQLALFGSLARDEADENSDIDLVVTLVHPLGFAYIKLANYLEERLGRKVDLITSTTLQSTLVNSRRAHIAREIQESMILCLPSGETRTF